MLAAGTGRPHDWKGGPDPELPALGARPRIPRGVHGGGPEDDQRPVEPGRNRPLHFSDSGEAQIEQALVDAHRRRPDAIGVAIGFNDAQARRIFAGSDFTLMPSRFEPCGLSQMYAQRFGSLPIGHQTGGLAETIKDGETGFLFSQPSAESFLGGVRRAFDTFRAKDRLDAMRRSAMAMW